MPDWSGRDRPLPVVSTYPLRTQSLLASRRACGSPTRLTVGALLQRHRRRPAPNLAGSGPAFALGDPGLRRGRGLGAPGRPFSNGSFRDDRPFHMGIAQIFAAPIPRSSRRSFLACSLLPTSTRDGVAPRPADVGFIPLWLGLVTGTGCATGLTAPATAVGVPGLIDRAHRHTSRAAADRGRARRRPAYACPSTKAVADQRDRQGECRPLRHRGVLPVPARHATALRAAA